MEDGKPDFDRTETVPLTKLKSEDGADDLLQSEMMRPYMKVAEAMVTRQGLTEAVAAIAALPLGQRYVWRVLSALKWGFADFDNINVVVDRKTLTPEDRIKVAELLKHRPVQFCIFLKALIGGEGMERMMMQAIKIAKQVPGE
jgi:hypothetical protein